MCIRAERLRTSDGRTVHVNETSASWHVSPSVDLTAYAFSWALVLVPLTLLADRTAQIALLLLVVGLTFAHRHYTLPYVYLDRQTFEMYPARFTWFPLVMLVGFTLSPLLWTTSARIVVAAVVFFAGAWNVWHVYMQKYGILRLYAAKERSGTGHPRWVDRFLLFSWVPLYLVWLGPSYRDEIATSFPTVESLALPLVDAMARLGPPLVVPAAAVVAASLVFFTAYEWRASRFRNRARLGMALGTSGLSASFLLFNPVHVFMAFAFSHAVEYMVFVWAFQKKRYEEPLAHRPMLGEVLRRPWLAYLGFTLGITVPYLLARFYGYLLFPSATNPIVLGTTIERWAFYWSVYQSLVHFYFDGFLWKMRRPATIEHL
jgi:hypothetical protein